MQKIMHFYKILPIQTAIMFSTLSVCLQNLWKFALKFAMKPVWCIPGYCSFGLVFQNLDLKAYYSLKRKELKKEFDENYQVIDKRVIKPALQLA